MERSVSHHLRRRWQPVPWLSSRDGDPRPDLMICLRTSYGVWLRVAMSQALVSTRVVTEASRTCILSSFSRSYHTALRVRRHHCNGRKLGWRLPGCHPKARPAKMFVRHQYLSQMQFIQTLLTSNMEASHARFPLRHWSQHLNCFLLVLDDFVAAVSPVVGDVHA
jgi:hypothetical protein